MGIKYGQTTWSERDQGHLHIINMDTPAPSLWCLCQRTSTKVYFYFMLDSGPGPAAGDISLLGK